MPFRERVAIVAGASGGIGSATVRAFLAKGMRVVLAAPQDPLLEAIAKEMEPYGDRALVVPTDITRREDIDRLAATTLVAYGRIDVLANVAGIGASPSVCETTDDELERVLSVNLLGAARLIQAVLPIMKAQRSGSIVNIGSVAGEAAVMGIYSASKFGLRGLNDSIRREVKSHNIGVTLIQPGFVRTTMNPAMNKLPPPEIVADAIVAAVEKPRRKHIVPGNYRLPVFLVNAFPGLTDLVFGNATIQKRLNRDARAARAAGQATQVESA
jgi:NAD(P)-dependent dehydrogenase (short-subunit alcohol dehydrogenase family)